MRPTIKNDERQREYITNARDISTMLVYEVSTCVCSGPDKKSTVVIHANFRFDIVFVLAKYWDII